MRKTLRLFMLLFVATLCGNTMAQTVFDFDTDGKTLLGLPGESASKITDGDITENKTAVKDGIKLTVSAKSDNMASPTENRLWNSSPKLRLYSGFINFEAPAGKVITKVEFALNSTASSAKWGAKNEADKGTITDNGGVAKTWTGNEASFKLTISGGIDSKGKLISGNTQIKTITVTLSDATQPGGVGVPTISGTSPFVNETTITITPSDADNAVYYTVDNSDPKTSATKKTYSAPFSITETTTVKAYEEDVQGNVGEVAEQTFTKKQAIVANNIKEFIALNVGDEATLKLNNAKVLYSFTSNKGNNQTFLRDNTGAICMFNTGINFANNQDVNGEAFFKYDVYKNLPEATKTTGTTADNLLLTDGTAAEAKTIAIADAANYVCDLVSVENVTITKEETTDASGKVTTKYYGTDKSGNKIQIFNGFYLDAYNNLETYVGQVFNVKGIMIIFGTTYEIYPIENAFTTGINDVTIENNKGSNEIYNLQGQKVNSSYKGIVIKNGKKYQNK